MARVEYECRHKHGKLLRCMSVLGLLKLQQGGRPIFPAVKKGFRLLLDNVNDTDPTDIAYTYAGYAPLSIRLVEHALRSGEGSSRDAGMEEALKSVPGPAFDVLQNVDEHGLPVEQSSTAGRGSGEFLLTWHHCQPLLAFIELLSGVQARLRCLLAHVQACNLLHANFVHGKSKMS